MKQRLAAVLLLMSVLITGCGSTKTSSKHKNINAELEEASRLAEGYFYDEAIELLEESKYKTNQKIIDKAEEIKGQKAELVKYEGQFYHVFFHSLIVYPELAFDGDYTHEGYDMWMTTVSEFKAMLPQLYERGFILYSIKDVQAGKDVMLPPGKKPLIISIDDVCYYDYMKNDGFAEKLVINDEGEVACQVRTPDGETIVTYDGDVMPILDQFVKEHPDFSYRGAKGVMAVTAYQGALGYRITDLEGEELTKAQNQVVEIATLMKENGWLFANHSYTHNSRDFKDGKVLYDVLVNDTERWKQRLAPYVLEPDIYISPFGYHLNPGDERLNYLQSAGYNYYCPVGKGMRTTMTDEGIIIQERFNLDRYNMRSKKEFINETFFDVDSVYYNIPDSY